MVIEKIKNAAIYSFVLNDPDALNKIKYTLMINWNLKILFYYCLALMGFKHQVIKNLFTPNKLKK